MKSGKGKKGSDDSDSDDSDVDDLDDEEVSLGSMDEEDFGDELEEDGGTFMDVNQGGEDDDDDEEGKEHRGAAALCSLYTMWVPVFSRWCYGGYGNRCVSGSSGKLAQVESVFEKKQLFHTYWPYLMRLYINVDRRGFLFCSRSSDRRVVSISSQLARVGKVTAVADFESVRPKFRSPRFDSVKGCVVTLCC